MPERKIKLRPPPGSKVAGPKVVMATPTVKAKPVAKIPKAGVPSDKVHPVSGLQPGQTFASPWTNRNRSTTPINTTGFGQKIGDPLTSRRLDMLKNLVEHYGRRAFQRSDLDAAVLFRLGERGLIEFVAGDPSSETCQFRVTERGEQAVI